MWKFNDIYVYESINKHICGKWKQNMKGKKMSVSTGMFADERYKEIRRLLAENGSVTVSELMERFHISIETVRRDLMALERQKELKRVHGGAIRLTEMKQFKQVSLRKHENFEEKNNLTHAGVNLVQEGDIISIDSGSTAVLFAKALKGKFNKLTVITHSLDVFRELEQEGQYKKILVGGEYLESESSFCGELAIQFLDEIHVEKAFICPSAVSLEGGVQDFITELVPVQKSFVRHASKVYVMADSSKIEKTALMKICDLSVCDVVITDDKLDERIKEHYFQAKVKIMKAGEVYEKTSEEG